MDNINYNYSSMYKDNEIIVEKNNVLYNIKNKAYNYNQENPPMINNNNYSIVSNGNNSNIDFQNEIYLNQNNYLNNETLYNNQNNASISLNNNSYVSNSNELPLVHNNMSMVSNFNSTIVNGNNGVQSTSIISNRHIIHNGNKNYDDTIIEATKKIPIIRFYIFAKKLKAKLIYTFLYRISYILNIFDINKRINFLNSLPFKLPDIVQKIFLINFPIKVIKAILPNYKTYHIPTTQEIIEPFLEMVVCLTSIPVSINSYNNMNEISYVPNNDNYQPSGNLNNNNADTYQNQDKKINNSKDSMSPLTLPQTELPYHNSPGNIKIIQTPHSYLSIDDSHNNFEINKEDRIINNNGSYIDNVNNISTQNNSLPIKDYTKTLSKISSSNTQSEKSKNKNENEMPYNFLSNNMKLKSNLTLFPLSPYITLKNSDFDSDTNEIEIESVPDQSEDINKPIIINSDNNVNESSTNNTNTNSTTSSTETVPTTTAANINNSSSNNSTLNVSSFTTAATLSTVAASIAALKSSSTSSTSSKSSLSRNEKRKLSLIKGSNIVKNIVKNFEEINNFYQNSLLKEAENINNTKLAKRNSSRKLEINNSDNNNNNDEFEIEDDHVNILQKEICQDPLEIDELNNIDNDDDNKNNKNNNIEAAVVTNDNNDEDEDDNKKENGFSEIDNSIENKMNGKSNEINNNDKINIINSEISSNEYLDPPSFLKESDIATIRESNAILNSYFSDTNINLNNSNNNESETEIIKDISLENNIEDSASTNSEISNAIFGGSVISVDDLDITRLTVLLIENFIKLSDIEKEDFLNSEYFDLIKNHIMSIQDNEEVHFSSIFKDPKMLNEFESHIEALQQCVKERDDIINYYYQEIINERIQNEKLLNFCENEQLEREETNKIISGLSKKIEMEEDYINKLEVRCEMLMEKIRKYQTCCKHYEKSISLLSGNHSNAFKKLINSQTMDWKKNMSDLSESLNSSLLNGHNQSSVSNMNINNNNNSGFNAKALLSTNFEDSTATSSISSSSATMTNETGGRPGIAHLINKLSTEKLSKNEEVQYLKSLLKSYNGKHIYINENVIKKQIIKKTASASQNIPATVDDVPVLTVPTLNDNNNNMNMNGMNNMNNMNNSGSSPNKSITSSKKMMMEKYLNDGKQYSNREDIGREDDRNNEKEEKEEKNYNHINNDYLMDDDDDAEEEEDDVDDIDEDEMVNHSRSIDLSIIDDLNIFNEKHYQEKVLQHQSFIKSYEDDSFCDYSPTLVN